MQNHFPYHWGAATSWVKFSSCRMVHSTISQQFIAGWWGGGGCLQWKWQCQGAESSYPGWHWAGAWALTCLLWPKLPSASPFPQRWSGGTLGWDMGLAQDEAHCPPPCWHIQQLMLVVGSRVSTTNGLDTCFCGAVLPACSILVLLHTSGNGELSYNSQSKSTFISSYLPNLTFQSSWFPGISRGTSPPVFTTQQSSYGRQGWIWWV